MSVVVGLDLSLTSSGVAAIHNILDEPLTAEVHAVPSTSVGDATAARWDRLGRITDLLVGAYLPPAPPPAMVVVEGPSYGSSAQRSASIHDRAGLWWRVVGRLLDNDIPVAVCPPTVRAKWATGRGNAGKSEVAVAVGRYWPEVQARSDDEWDALALASIAAQRLGWALTVHGYQREALAKVAWPDLPDPTARGAA